MEKQLSNQEKWKVWQGFVYFAVLMILLFGPYSLLNIHLGLVGLLLGQIMFLASALIVTKLHKTPIKEVFPINKIGIKDFFGILIFSVGTILGNMGLTGLCIALFPQGLETVQETSDFLFKGSLPPVVIVLIVSLAPAICEESIMRGALLSHFRGIKKDWIICLLVGTAFGIMHTDIVKFIPTVFVGAVLALVVLKRNNILLASIIHFLNNFLSSLMGVLGTTDTDPAEVEAAADAATKAVTDSTSARLGVAFLFFFLAPIFLLAGARLLNITKKSGKKWVVAIILSIILFVAGVAFISMAEAI